MLPPLIFEDGEILGFLIPGGSNAGPDVPPDARGSPALLSFGIPPAKRPPSPGGPPPPLPPELLPPVPEPPPAGPLETLPTTGALLSFVTVFFNLAPP